MKQKNKLSKLIIICLFTLLHANCLIAQQGKVDSIIAELNKPFTASKQDTVRFLRVLDLIFNASLTEAQAAQIENVASGFNFTENHRIRFEIFSNFLNTNESMSITYGKKQVEILDKLNSQEASNRKSLYLVRLRFPFRNTERLEEGFRYFSNKLNNYIVNNDSIVIAQCYFVLGGFYSISGLSDLAVFNYKKANSYIDTLKNKGRWINNMAVLGGEYLLKGDKNESLHYSRIVFREYQKIKAGYSFSALNIASVMLLNNELDSAAWYITIAKQDPASIRSNPDKCSALQTEALYKIQKGDLEDAEELLKKCWQLIIENNIPVSPGAGTIAPDYYLALLRIKQNRYEEAITLLKKDIERLKNNRLAVIRDYKLMAELYKKTGKGDKAAETYAIFIAKKDSVLSAQDKYRSISFEAEQQINEKERFIATLQTEQEKKELALQKEIALKALKYEFEKKQAAAKSEREKQQLQYEQQLRQQQIEATYARKTAEIEMELQRKEAITKVEQEKKDALNASALALAQAEVKRKNQERNYFIIGFGLLVALLGFIVYGYFQKQKANTLLQHQRDEIDQKSRQLEKSLSELKSTQSQLIQSEKMASLGELTAGIAHEIQNPLNFVNNFSEISNELISELKVESLKVESERDKVLEDELLNDIAQNLEKINHHGNRASSIVKGMLEHSRTSSGTKEPTNINGLADEYLRLAYQGLRAKDKDFNATMETHFDPNLPKIDVIPQDIGRVLLNLITNAFYAVNERSKNIERAGSPSGVGGKGGQRQKPTYEPTVTVTTQLTANSQLLIAVEDNGSGIPDAIKDKIFQPFFTTKPTGQGTGLGLSLAYDIVKAHGGELKVESGEGRGTEFKIQIPIS